MIPFGSRLAGATPSVGYALPTARHRRQILILNVAAICVLILIVARQVLMPWKESSVMEECLRFVARLLDGSR
jgi:hypothetical protein